jgi:hypothetical protein
LTEEKESNQTLFLPPGCFLPSKQGWTGAAFGLRHGIGVRHGIGGAADSAACGRAVWLVSHDHEDFYG